MKIGNSELFWLGHSGFLVKCPQIIYIDPFEIKENSPKADIILITHGHYDHCSFVDLKKIIKEGTQIFVTADAQSKIARFEIPVQMQLVEPNQEFIYENLKIVSVPAYNLDKPFHSKEENLVGYVVKTEEFVLYHAGDTDLIPEMQKLTGHKNSEGKFIVLLPIGGRFTMSVEEAFEATKLLKPDLVIPMHWGTIIGSKEDALEFKELCLENNFECEILQKE
jgi:L-ascorbate metabolism protein UlaG (beta-lactamase superfamily)